MLLVDMPTGYNTLVSLYSSGPTAQGMMLPRVGLEIINNQDKMTKIYPEPNLNIGNP